MAKRNDAEKQNEKSRVPILKFPYLVVLIILRQCDFNTLFYLSAMRKNQDIRKLVKLSKALSHVYVLISCGSDPMSGVTIYDDRGNGVQIFHIRFIDDEEQRDTNGTEMIMYLGEEPTMFRPSQNAANILTEDCADLFVKLMNDLDGMGVNCATVQSFGRCFNIIRSTFDFLESHKWKLKNVSIIGLGVPRALFERMYRYSLHRCEELKLYSTTHLNTVDPVDADPNEPSRIRRFAIDAGAMWFTFDHLISLRNCEFILVMNTALDHEDFNRALKMWKTGAANFSRLQIAVRQQDLLVEGLDAVEFNDLNAIRRYTNITNPSGLDPKNYKFRRDDTMIGIISYRDRGHFSGEIIFSAIRVPPQHDPFFNF